VLERLVERPCTMVGASALYRIRREVGATQILLRKLVGIGLRVPAEQRTRKSPL
jgi:hypothetical protein